MANSIFRFSSISSTTLLLLIVPLLSSPAPAASAALKCTSQKFTAVGSGGAANYSECADLPALNSFLHWSYDQTNSTLSVAFASAPPKPGGWIAWALNPTGTGMAGAQTLLAYKAPNGSMVVKTYNISSYSSIVESKLSFDVLDKKAEVSGDGVMRIFATLALPKGMTMVNQIWQVGASVTNGVPQKHDFSPENLNAKATLEVMKTSKIGGAPAPAPAPGTSATSGPGSGASRISIRLPVLELYGFLLLSGILIFGF